MKNSRLTKTAGLRSAPYQKLFKQILDKERSEASFARIIRSVKEHNPGIIKWPSVAMKDALTKMKLQPDMVEIFKSNIRNPPSALMAVMLGYLQSGAPIIDKTTDDILNDISKSSSEKTGEHPQRLG